MKTYKIGLIGIFLMAFSAVLALISRASQDRYTLKALNGVAFEEFKGYEEWEAVAPSQTEDGIKIILANPLMMKAYREGVPGNGKPFPEGSKIVKIEWVKQPNPESQYAVNVPGALKSVSFIEKDSKRFQDTSGWGYAQFSYDPGTDTFKPFGADAHFGAKICYPCHVAVKDKDYIFTAYPKR